MAYSIFRDRLLGTAAAAVLIIGSFVSGAAFLAAKAQAAETSLLFVHGTETIHPVAVSDGHVHLVYELLLVNQGMVAVSIDSIDVTGIAGRVLQTMSNADLKALSRQSLLGGDGTMLQPSQSGMIFMDVVLPVDEDVPSQIGHVFHASLSAPEGGGEASFGGLTVKPGDVTGSLTFSAADLPVDPTPAVVISSPVRGNNWVVFRGCCDLMNSHRGTTSFTDGRMHVAERFAIDFVQTNDDGMMIVGPGNKLASYVYVGAEILAVADGTVVVAHNDQPNQTPGTFPVGLSDDDAGGNAVVLDIGGGRYVLYAHMMPGSVTVEAGDEVKAGDVLGRLGNSGKTIGPHLHFHVMDNVDWQIADGVPFVFDDFTGQGVLADGALMIALQGQVVEVDVEGLRGPHHGQHPLNNQLIDYGH